MEAQKDTPTSGSELVTTSGPVPLPVLNGTVRYRETVTVSIPGAVPDPMS